MIIARHLRRDAYQPTQAWPEGCQVQWGESFAPADVFFFEAFPTSPGFHRGEGETQPAAEIACWQAWRRTVECPGHDWDRHGRNDGWATCTRCGLGHISALPPTAVCRGCGSTCKPYTTDVDERPWCKACYPAMPADLVTDMDRENREYAASQAGKRAANVAAGRSFPCSACPPSSPVTVDFDEDCGIAICRGCDTRYFLDDSTAAAFAMAFGDDPSDRRFPC